jgi:hydrogenase maturation protease
VIEADLDSDAAVPEAHAMDPAKVIALARQLGPLPRRVVVVGCEPSGVMSAEDDEIVAQLSEPVRAAVPAAVREVDALLASLGAETQPHDRKAQDS